MRKKRWLAGAAAVISLVIMMSMETMAAPENWKQDEKGWWYQKDDGSYYKDTWAAEDGAWYHFDKSGYRDTGWLEENSVWYYLGEDGRMCAGTSLNIDGYGYTFDNSGAWIGNALPGVYPGSWQGNVFTNTWANYKLTLPEDGIIIDTQVMRDVRTETYGAIDAKEMEKINLTELVVQLPAEGSLLKICYQNGNGVELLELDDMTKVLIQLYGITGYQVENVEPVVLGGLNYNRIRMTMANGIVKMEVYVRKVDTTYMTIEAAYMNGYDDEIEALINSIAPAV